MVLGLAARLFGSHSVCRHFLPRLPAGRIAGMSDVPHDLPPGFWFRFFLMISAFLAVGLILFYFYVKSGWFYA
jgi:hypothetical protein